MKFLTNIPTNRKAEITNMFHGFNADYSNEERTFEIKGVNVFAVENGVKEDKPSWGVVACKCGWVAILPGETDYENCFLCGKGWAK